MAANGVQAANIMRGFTNLRYGMCLFYVWQAYARAGASTDRNAETALEGWDKSDGKHPGDRNPPAGVPVWFGAKPSSSAGDVVISLGNGMVVATDYPRYGVIGVCTIQQRQDQIGRPYLGWSETILGAPIDYDRGGKPASSTPATPNVPEEDNMSAAAVRVKVGSNPDRFHYFNVSEEFLKHCDSLAQSQIVAAVYSTTDETHTLSTDQFWNLLDGQGIPRDVVKIETGAVLNPQSGKFEGGGVWSRRREAVAKLDQLLGKA